MNFLDILFPPYCVGCGKVGTYVCKQCFSTFRTAYDSCYLCHKPSFLGKIHEQCKEACGLDGTLSVWKYEGVMRKLIHAFKYKFSYDMATTIAELMLLTLDSKKGYIPKAVLVPIPLHEKRFKWRGFNQSDIVGRRIAFRMGWQVEQNILRRIKYTSSQVLLNKTERQTNMKAAFVVNKELLPKVENKKIVLFDDVWTTGSTIHSASCALKQAGAGSVWALTIARG